MEQISQISLIGLIGLAFGSFLNVLIWRLNDPKAPRFWQGRSLCPRCRHRLAWFDNIPLLSFIFLRGRCRYCQQSISWYYPAVELLTASYFVMTGLHPVMWLIGAAFIIIFFSDLIYGLIPDEAVAAGLILSFLGYLSHLSSLPAATATGLIAAGFFLAIFLLTRQKGLGFGDVKLAFLMGFLLGPTRSLVAFWAAFILGGTTALVLLTLRRTKLSATIALGPFLVLGTIIAALWTEDILSLAGIL